MTKKIIIFILLFIFIIGGLIGGFYFRNRIASQTVPFGSNILPTPTIAEELTTWKDQSGFSFQYPKSLKLDPHEEDQENYAHLELTSATFSGSLIVWAKDTTAEDIEGWIKQKKIENAFDSNLGGEKAKKILTSDNVNKANISTIYEDYLYQIEANLSDDYWNKVYETVSSSFHFISEDNQNKVQAPQEQSPADGEGEIIEEEIVE